jgi:polyphosphate kinase
VLGRFLEHSRIYYFHNKGVSDLYVGSADLMPRNIDRRVEVLFPVHDVILRKEILDNILKTYLYENKQAYALLADGTYERRNQQDATTLSSQEWLLNKRVTLQQQADISTSTGGD